jgi:hypothetical protein
VPLEYDLPNITGSVAMARTKDPNSATDEWFVNLIDNTNNLGPASDGTGYTVFGQVIGNGMHVVNAIPALSFDNADNGGTYAQLPLGPNNELVRISSVTIDSVDGTVFSDTNSNGQLARASKASLDAPFLSTRPVPASSKGATQPLPPIPAATTPSRALPPVLTKSTKNCRQATNGNGTLDAGETGLAGRMVFLNNDNTGFLMPAIRRQPRIRSANSRSSAWRPEATPSVKCFPAVAR